jgi:hypothetical protein
MRLIRTDKASLELASKTRGLSLRERGALFLVDGLRTRDQLLEALQGDEALLQRLSAEGYIIVAKDEPNLPAAVLRTTSTNTAPIASVSNQETSTPSVSADGFEGKRSMATTRMFLFDICERMFARKVPVKAEEFREQLRQARDRETMLEVAREMLTLVEELAGSERAEGLRDRIEMLLPAHAA